MKLNWIDTLEHLSESFPLRYFTLTDDIHNYNTKIVMEQNEPVSKYLEFGVALENRNTKGIPSIVTDCCDYIIKNGLDQEGIFRTSGSKSKMDLAIRKWNLGCLVDLDSLGIHAVAGLLKCFIRTLPDTMLPHSLQPLILSFSAQENLPYHLKCVLLPKLPKDVVALFKCLFYTLYQVQLNSHINRMTGLNLAIIFTPNFLKDADSACFLTGLRNVESFQKIILSCILEYESVFCDTLV